MASHAHIPGCARLGVMRLNAARLNYYERIGVAIIDGVDRTRQVRIAGAAVTHVLNEAPDTAHVRVHGVAPVAGQTFALYDGDVDPARQLFGGRVLETTAVYESLPRNVAYDLQAIDPTWLLNRQRVLFRYLAASATAIVVDIVARFTRGVTTAHVAAGLPVIDLITFTNETVAAALTAVCERIGAYWYLDYTGDLHVFLSETPDANPITDANPRGSSDHTLTEDLSQVVTRVVARGGGGQAAVDVPITATEIPIDDPAWFSDAGGIAEVAGHQRVPYNGVSGRIATGALVGTGNSPSAAPAPTPAGGSSHTLNATYQYAATFTTAAGETLPGPIGSITIKTITMVPPPALSARTRGPGSYPPGMISAGGSPIRFAAQIVYTGGAWGPLGVASGSYAWDGHDWEVYLGTRAPYLDGSYYPVLEPAGPVATVNHVQILRSDNGGPWMYVSTDGFGSGGGWYYQCASSWSSGAVQPATGFGSVIVKGIPTSTAPGVTGRKVYRTIANGAALKLLTTIANNTATEAGDTVADAALGAAAPTNDTSGITDNRQHPAGSTVLPVSDTAPFVADSAAAGGKGWVRVAGMPVRYTGIGTGQLTGLPATGVGSLTATVRYGAQVLAQPRLRVPVVPVAITAGESVVIRLELDDVPAQIALAARFGSADHGDGIVEEPYSDTRMTLVELTNYAKALLADRKDPRRTLRFVTRDDTVEVGRLITISLTTPPIAGTFRVQRIQFDEIAITGGLGRVAPRRTVEASNKLYTFADLLRRMRGREGGAS